MLGFTSPSVFGVAVVVAVLVVVPCSLFLVPGGGGGGWGEIVSCVHLFPKQCVCTKGFLR